MQADMEAFARALLGNKQGEKINANFDKFSQIMSSKQGKAVVDTLMSDGGDGLRRAVQDAQNGNTDTAKQILTSVLATKEGADILRKIVEAASE